MWWYRTANQKTIILARCVFKKKEKKKVLLCWSTLLALLWNCTPPSLPSVATGCNSPLYARAAGSSGWESLARAVEHLSGESWRCAGGHRLWPPCRSLLCLLLPRAGWTCRCTGRAGSYESVCCCNCCYYFLHCCCCYCCCHLCRCSPSLSSAPLLRSSQPPEVLPERASGGQSCTTASYQPGVKVAGEFTFSDL